MISLTNTEIAFAHLSRRNLYRAKFIFLVMPNPIVSKLWHLFVMLFARLRIPIGWLTKHTISAQFVGGKNIEECNAIVDKFWGYRIFSIINYSVECEKNEETSLKNYNELLSTLKTAVKDNRIAFTNFKPSSLIDPRILLLVSEKSLLNAKDEVLFSEFKERVNNLCKIAYSGNKPIIIEAEESWFQPAVEELAEEMMAKYNQENAIVYECFQMYRIGTLEKLYSSHKKAVENSYTLGAKIVRGAYMEEERTRSRKLGLKSPIFETKEETDHAFNKAVKFCISNIDILSFYCGTHNEESILYMISLMESLNISKNDNRIFFSQLYGMSDNISFNLANDGFNVVKYIPYGPFYDVLPYLMRRIQENSAAKGETSRELKYINKELKRRKKAKE